MRRPLSWPDPTPARGQDLLARRTMSLMAEWWSIEVLHGEFSAFLWQEQHDSALIEAALTNGAVDGAWHADRWGGGAGDRQPRKPKPTPSTGTISLPEPQAVPHLDLTGISPPDPVRAGTA